MKRRSMVLLALFWLMAGCENQSPAQQRAAHIQGGSGDVVVAVAWPLPP
jgi:hypothetical protein